jgi:hypothetical protein
VDAEPILLLKNCADRSHFRGSTAEAISVLIG